jgi:prepilin signal peptidase PulO-like enzyme (type II secretory pathway)
LAIGYIAILLGIALSLYDLQAQFLPAKMLYLLIGIGLVYYLIQSLTLPIVMVDIFMLLLPSIFLIMIHVVSRGKWMGVGDGILFIGLSLLLGDFLLALYALVVSSWLGAGIGSVVLLVEKRRSKKAISNSIPFGPFLVLGSFIIWWMSLANIYIV